MVNTNIFFLPFLIGLSAYVFAWYGLKFFLLWVNREYVTNGVKYFFFSLSILFLVVAMLFEIRQGVWIFVLSLLYGVGAKNLLQSQRKKEGIEEIKNDTLSHLKVVGGILVLLLLIAAIL